MIEIKYKETAPVKLYNGQVIKLPLTDTQLTGV